ncbi:pectinesterase family protein [Streptomyces sp. DSM 44915]|uniref:Pectinesterase family protein n=1 Tax=Streptomyces chisholmiae TaxID=3075540 RepID=A0ABU2JLP8_9ACTN|nr:pectinesterase family protein [Streptomyces sp. DSM 44915]MDT0265905.1 pectinesterase family protein [Streptomyces sp. DSM 44915]
MPPLPPRLRRPRARSVALLAALATAGTLAVSTANGSTPDRAAPADAAGPVLPAAWPAEADGFASVNALGQDGTYGGRDGETVTVTTEEELRRYATADEPYTIQVAAAIEYAETGEEIPVASDKTIVGVGTTGEIVGGGFFLGEGTHNVIIRNLTIRDTYDGDWDGKTHDWDAIQMDGAHHVWIDHNHLTRMADGLIDSRKDTTYLTVSWNHLSEHNKAFGIGWTENVTAEITIHHNWLHETGQRNPSADNIARAHLYNNYLLDDPAGDISMSYGNWARGATNMVLENSYFENVRDPYFVDPEGQLVERGNILDNTSGRAETRGDGFDPGDYYDYTLDAAEDVPELLRAGTGPQADIGTSAPAVEDADLVVAPDGSGDFTSVADAVEAVPAGNDAPFTIAVEPGVYRETVLVPRDRPHVRLVGTGDSPDDATIVYNNSAGTERPDGGTYGTSGSATFAVDADDFQATNLTFANDFDEVANADQEGHQAVALRTRADRVVLRDIIADGDQDTLLLDTESKGVQGRVLLVDSTVRGNVDFVFGRATAVIQRTDIEVVTRPDGSSSGYVAAPSTVAEHPGFLIVDSRITGDVSPGSYYLGRPWYAGGDAALHPQVVVRDTELGAAVRSAPWTDMSGFPWTGARFAEYRNTGDGAGQPGPDRPQLTDEEAAHHTPESWLGDWTPAG